MKQEFNNQEYLTRKFLNEDSKLLILSITRRCNLKCAYCRGNNEWYDMLSKNSSSIDYPKERWEMLKEFCRKNKIEEVLLTGGEPILYPSIKEFIKFLDKNKIRFSIHTNGVEPRWYELINFLKSENIRPNIAMSLELFENLQKNVRGSDIPFDIIEMMIESGFNIELKVTLHQLLLNYLDDIENRLRYYQNIGIKSIRFQPVQPIGNSFCEDLKLNPKFIELIDKLVMLKSSDSKMKDFIRNSCESFEAIKSLILKGKVEESVVKQCDVAEKIMFLNTDGTVLNCKTLWNKENKTCSCKTFDFVCCGYKD